MIRATKAPEAETSKPGLLLVSSILQPGSPTSTTTWLSFCSSSSRSIWRGFRHCWGSLWMPWNFDDLKLSFHFTDSDALVVHTLVGVHCHLFPSAATSVNTGCQSESLISWIGVDGNCVSPIFLNCRNGMVPHFQCQRLGCTVDNLCRIETHFLCSWRIYDRNSDWGAWSCEAVLWVCKLLSRCQTQMISRRLAAGLDSVSLQVRSHAQYFLWGTREKIEKSSSRVVKKLISEEQRLNIKVYNTAN